MAVELGIRVAGHSDCVIQVLLDRSQDLELLAQYRKNLWTVLGVALVLCTVVGYQIARQARHPTHLCRQRHGPCRIHAAN